MCSTCAGLNSAAWTRKHLEACRRNAPPPAPISSNSPRGMYERTSLRVMRAFKALPNELDPAINSLAETWAESWSYRLAIVSGSGRGAT